MKKTLLGILCLFVLMPFSGASAAGDGSTVKEGVKSIVSGVVSTGKDTISGIGAGVDSGRKEGDSTDEAQLVSTKDDFSRLVSAKAVKSENLGNNRFKITVALKNDNEFPVRITNLTEPKNIMLIDKEGFSSSIETPLVQGKDITALPKSLTRLRYVFGEVESEPVTFRLFEADTEVPPSVAPAAKN